MKHQFHYIIILLVTLVFAIASDTNAQIADNENICVAVSLTKQNVLYCGAPNTLDIAVSGYKPDEIQVSISKGTIEPNQYPGGYIVRILEPGLVKIIVSSNGKELAIKEFRAKRVPDPIARVGGCKPGEKVKKNFLSVQPGVKAYLENFDYDVAFSVINFTISATINDGVVKSVTSEHAAFNAEQMELIMQALSGTKIYIENIKAKGLDGTIRDLPSIYYELE